MAEQRSLGTPLPHDLNSFPEQNPNPVLRIDKEGNFVYANPVGQKYLIANGCAMNKPAPDCLRSLALTSLERGVNSETEVKWENDFFVFLLVPVKQNNYVNVYGHRITERKNIEEALRESEERYHTLADTAPDAIVVHRDGELLYANSAALDLYGAASYEQLASKNLLDLVPSNGKKQATERVQAVMTGEKLPLRVTEIFRIDGKTVPVDVISSPIEYKGKLAVLAILRDITERKKAEDALKASEENYKHLLQYAPTAIYEIDYYGPKFKNVNDAMVQLTGYSREELLAKSPFDLLDSESKELFQDRIRRILDGEKVDESVEFGVLVKGGRKLSVILYLKPLYKKGKLDGALVVGYDITERKKMEEELRKSRDELEKRVSERTKQTKEQAELLDKAHEAINLRDMEGHILYWNKGSQRMYGYSSEEAIGKKIYELIFEKKEQYDFAFSEVCAKGEWNGELNHISKDGRALIVDAHWTLVTNSKMKPSTVICIGTDITDRKKLETQYMRAQRLESLGTLAGGIAHDFRNILTPITITLDLIDQNLTRDEDHEMIEALQKNLQRGADLAKQLLTFARGAEGDRVPLSVPALIFEIEKTIKETFPRSINVVTKIDPALPTILGDSTQLHQVLINMSLNARDAMPFGGTLSISAESVFIDQYYAKLHRDAKVGSYVTISIVDNGTGMPSEVLERIFEPFFTTKKPGMGTGLGLSTARSIVKSHGGFINVYSEVGKGSTFKIYLPAYESKGESKEGLTISSLPQGKGETVLVIDDEELIRITTVAALENNGYRVLGASDGAEALGTYMQHKDEIKAVLIDMAMPIMDGEATIRALKKISPEVKIIGMSGFAENGKYKAMYNITNAFITKPFTASKLLETINKVIAE